MVCALFGNRDAQYNLRELIMSKVLEIINSYPVSTFYVGNNGNFDRMVISVLKEISMSYPNIRCYIVLAYLPTNKNMSWDLPTIYPEEIEKAPKRFAIVKRNQWMLNKSDIVIFYCHNISGNTGKLKLKAGKLKTKIIFDLAE